MFISSFDAYTILTFEKNILPTFLVGLSAIRITGTTWSVRFTTRTESGTGSTGSWDPTNSSGASAGGSLTGQIQNPVSLTSPPPFRS